MNKRYLASVLVFLLNNSVFATFAMAEVESNDSLATANEIIVESFTSEEGSLSSCTDNDFYKFFGMQGDTVNVDIDNGAGGNDSVNTYVAIFSEDGTILRSNDDGAPNDEISTTDSYIDSFVIPDDGFYFIGVTNYSRPFENGGTNSGTSCDSSGGLGGFFDTTQDPEMTGDYQLNITYISNQVSEPDPEEVDVFIQLSPGHVDYRPINPRSWGIVKVAILSRAGFDAPVVVDRSTLTFGATGDELQNAKCRTKHVNRKTDGLLDLVCKFEIQAAGFSSFDEEATLKGKTTDGRDIIGRGHIKLEKRHRGHHEKRQDERGHHRDDH